MADELSSSSVIKRHSLVTRITHWINVIALSFLLLSGLQIFNAHPRLYWGQYGANADKPALVIRSLTAGEKKLGTLEIGDLKFKTTGVLGASKVDGQWQSRAFPAWATLPSYKDLGTGRRWHFFFAWLFVINGLVYLGVGFARRHIQRDLIPVKSELAPRHLWQEIKDHARLRFPKGEGARHYNALQKLAYAGVALGLLPLMVLTGLTMSPGFNAVFPWFLDIFGGRQSARTLHFIFATLTVGFVIVHVAMVLLSGVWNNMRSMITGDYDLDPNKTKAARREDTP